MFNVWQKNNKKRYDTFVTISSNFWYVVRCVLKTFIITATICRITTSDHMGAPVASCVTGCLLGDQEVQRVIVVPDRGPASLKETWRWGMSGRDLCGAAACRPPAGETTPPPGSPPPAASEPEATSPPPCSPAQTHTVRSIAVKARHQLRREETLTSLRLSWYTETLRMLLRQPKASVHRSSTNTPTSCDRLPAFSFSSSSSCRSNRADQYTDRQQECTFLLTNNKNTKRCLPFQP